MFAQVDAFRSLGYEVTYSGYLNDGVGIFNDKEELVAFKKYPIKNEKIRHIIRRGLLMSLCREYIESSKEKYDLSYGTASGKTAMWLFPTFYVRELYGILAEWIGL